MAPLASRHNPQTIPRIRNGLIGLPLLPPGGNDRRSYTPARRRDATGFFGARLGLTPRAVMSRALAQHHAPDPRAAARETGLPGARVDPALVLVASVRTVGRDVV